MTSQDSPAALARYANAARAPKPIRRAMRLGEIDRALNAVTDWRNAYDELDRAEYQFVSSLRSRGLSWDSIGWFLTVTGDAVRQRFSERIEADRQAADERDAAR